MHLQVGEGPDLDDQVLVVVEEALHREVEHPGRALGVLQRGELFEHDRALTHIGIGQALRPAALLLAVPAQVLAGPEPDAEWILLRGELSELGHRVALRFAGLDGREQLLHALPLGAGLRARLWHGVLVTQQLLLEGREIARHPLEHAIIARVEEHELRPRRHTEAVVRA